jgi:hypothetical protein
VPTLTIGHIESQRLKATAAVEAAKKKLDAAESAYVQRLYGSDDANADPASVKKAQLAMAAARAELIQAKLDEEAIASVWVKSQEGAARAAFENAATARVGYAKSILDLLARELDLLQQLGDIQAQLVKVATDDSAAVNAQRMANSTGRLGLGIPSLPAALGLVNVDFGRLAADVAQDTAAVRKVGSK